MCVCNCVLGVGGGVRKGRTFFFKSRGLSEALLEAAMVPWKGYEQSVSYLMHDCLCFECIKSYSCKKKHCDISVGIYPGCTRGTVSSCCIYKKKKKCKIIYKVYKIVFAWITLFLKQKMAAVHSSLLILFELAVNQRFFYMLCTAGKILTVHNLSTESHLRRPELSLKVFLK